MRHVVHRMLGTIDASAAGFWETRITFAGCVVTVDLTIDGQELLTSAIEALPQTVEDLEPFDRAAREAILADAASGNDDAAATLYVTHHHDVLPTAEFQRLFGVPDPDPGHCGALLSRLKLVRVGLYPEHEDRPILFDYSIDRDATNYILCVSFDSRGQPIAVDLES